MRISVVITLLFLGKVLVASGQSPMDDIRAKILEDNKSFAGLKIDRKAEKVFFGMEFATISISMEGAKGDFALDRTVIFTINNDEKKLPNRLFSDFHIFDRDMIPGEVRQAFALEEGYLLQVEEEFKYPFSNRKIHRFYLLGKELRELEKIDFETVSYTNDENIGKQQTVDIAVAQTDGKTLIECTISEAKEGQDVLQAKPRVIQYRYDPGLKKLIPLVNSISLSRPGSIDGIWQQTSHIINGVEQRGAPMFEFDQSGNIILHTRNNRTYQIDSKLIGKFSLTAEIGKIEYSFTGMDADYEGNIFFNDEKMIQEALAISETEFFPRSLQLEKVWYDKPYDAVKQRVHSGDRSISLLRFTNALYTDRHDLLRLYVESGFNERSSVNLFIGDTAFLGYPIHLVALSGKPKAMKEVIEGGMDAGLLSFNGKSAYEFARMKSNQEMIDLLANYKAPMDEEIFRRNSLDYFKDFIRRQQGWEREEGIITVSIPQEKGRFLTVSVKYGNGAKGIQSDRCFYYQKDNEDSWILESDRQDFPDRVRGRCQNVLEIGGDTFLSTESTFLSGEKRLTEFTVYKFEKSKGKFIKTNLVFSQDITSDFCDYTRTFYEAKKNTSQSGVLEVTEISRVFVKCEVAQEQKSTSTYYWSDRQGKFLKTID